MGDVAFKIETKPLIPAGNYFLRFQGHETWLVFGREPKLALYFGVMDYGEYFETILPRFYRVKRLTGKAGKGGRFVPRGTSSNFVREFVEVAGAPARWDRVPLSRLSDFLIKGRVGTVKSDGAGKAIPKALRYSVIRELVGSAK